jgi:hypothetical protein
VRYTDQPVARAGTRVEVAPAGAGATVLALELPGDG